MNATNAMMNAMVRVQRLRPWRGLAVAAAFAATLALTAAPALSQATQSIAVLVNDEPISSYDIAQRSRFFEVTRRQDVTAQVREQIIDELIEERVKLQEARKNGIVVGEDQVNEVLDQMADGNNMTVQQLTEALGQIGVNIHTLREQVRANLAWRDVVRRKFQHRVVVGATEVDQALADGESGGGEARTELQLQRVHLEVPQGADQKALAARITEAEQLRARVSSCQGIADQVRRLSRATVRDAGRRNANDVPQPTRALLLAAKEGQMTPPVVTASGVELYAVCGMRTVQTDTEQRREVQAKLMDEEFQRLARGYLSDLRASAYIERPGNIE